MDAQIVRHVPVSTVYSNSPHTLRVFYYQRNPPPLANAHAAQLPTENATPDPSSSRCAASRRHGPLIPLHAHTAYVYASPRWRCARHALASHSFPRTIPAAAPGLCSYELRLPSASAHACCRGRSCCGQRRGRRRHEHLFHHVVALSRRGIDQARGTVVKAATRGNPPGG